MAFQQRIIALDPGGTTGWCTFDVGPSRWSGGQLDQEDHHEDLWHLLQRQQPNVVVYEAFNYQIRKHQGTTMPGVVLMSREYIGVAQLWCQLYQREIVKQQPSVVGLAWLKDPMLRKMGRYNTGEPHRNDATRHMLYYLVHTLGYKELLAPLRN